MKTSVLLLTLAAMAFAISATPGVAADHLPECSGEPDATEVCGWHHGWYDCYAAYVNGQEIASFC